MIQDDDARQLEVDARLDQALAKIRDAIIAEPPGVVVATAIAIIEIVQTPQGDFDSVVRFIDKLPPEMASNLIHVGVLSLGTMLIKHRKEEWDEAVRLYKDGV